MTFVTNFTNPKVSRSDTDNHMVQSELNSGAAGSNTVRITVSGFRSSVLSMG
jgi:hypothetical protein